MTGLPPETFDRINGTSTGDSARPEPAASSLSAPANWFVQWATGGTGTNEIAVNEFTALNYAALYTCVTLIAGTIAGLPCKVFRKRPTAGRTRWATTPPPTCSPASSAATRQQ
jgi:phage portal protein BeeE